MGQDRQTADTGDQLHGLGGEHLLALHVGGAVAAQVLVERFIQGLDATGLQDGQGDVGAPHGALTGDLLHPLP